MALALLVKKLMYPFRRGRREERGERGERRERERGEREETEEKEHIRLYDFLQICKEIKAVAIVDDIPSTCMDCVSNGIKVFLLFVFYF
jgi:hypothetical protein